MLESLRLIANTRKSNCIRNQEDKDLKWIQRRHRRRPATLEFHFSFKWNNQGNLDLLTLWEFYHSDVFIEARMFYQMITTEQSMHVLWDYQLPWTACNPDTFVQACVLQILLP